jgi:hypothetical protein
MFCDIDTNWLAGLIMWNFISNWFFARVLNRHRLLFRFWDGSRFVSSDPFILFRKLINTDKFDVEEDIKKLRIPDPKIVSEKIGFIAEGIREIFDLPPYEKGGLTELECVQLLIEFSTFLDRVKKNGASSLISLPPIQGNQEVPVAGSVDQTATKENSAST